MKEIYASRPNVLYLNTDLVFFLAKKRWTKNKTKPKRFLEVVSS